MPDGFDTIAEIIDDAASLNATTGREEATEDDAFIFPNILINYHKSECKYMTIRGIMSTFAI